MQGKRNSFFGAIIYILAAFFLFYEMALQVSPSVMTFELMGDLHLNAQNLGVMAAFYFYSYTLMQIPAGLLFDRFGPRILITIATFLIAMGSFFFGMTQTFVMASIGRFLMGIGSAFAFIGVLTVAARWFSSKYFAFLVGIAQFLAAMGAMGGELPLAAAVNHIGWRATINLLGVIGIVLSIVIAILMRDRPTDLHEDHIATHFKISSVLKEIFFNGQTYPIALYAFCGWAPVAVFAALWGVPYLMQRYLITNTHAALIVAMMWIGLSIAAPLLGWFSDLLKRRCFLLRAASLLGLIVSVILLYVPYLPLWTNYILLFLFGFAAAGQILSFALVKDNNRPSITSTAIGFNNMANVAGGALFQPLVGYFLYKGWDGAMHNGIPMYSIADYNMALLVVPACFLVGLILSSFFIRETYSKPKFDPYEDHLI
ncbi:MAG: MFS transporter [Simkaniaceae bacterium]|nr:MFS transporter [Simkaniaceae bacterium]